MQVFLHQVYNFLYILFERNILFTLYYRVIYDEMFSDFRISALWRFEKVTILINDRMKMKKMIDEAYLYVMSKLENVKIPFNNKEIKPEIITAPNGAKYLIQ